MNERAPKIPLPTNGDPFVEKDLEARMEF